MLFKLRDAIKVKRDGFIAYVYNMKSDYSSVNTIYVECHKNHERVYVKNSHRIYFLLEGNGSFNVGEQNYKVEQHDVVIIEPQVEYSYEGKMKLFEVNFPATDEHDEVQK
jgi:mannose-6-phosphate isomerase-like protein (cupin superfamily)